MVHIMHAHWWLLQGIIVFTVFSSFNSIEMCKSHKMKHYLTLCTTVHRDTLMCVDAYMCELCCVCTPQHMYDVNRSQRKQLFPMCSALSLR